MGKANLLLTTALAATLTAGLTAQKAGKPPKTWMDLPVGSDLTWRGEGADKSIGGRGTSQSNNGKHEIRIACLGATDDGKLRIAVIDEHLPKEKHETAIIRGEIALLDPATGQLERAADATMPLQWSPLAAFPYPPLSPKEWKSKKAGDKEVVAPIGGEPQLLTLKLTSGKAKVSRKKVRAVIAELDAKSPATVKMAGIAPLVAMAQGGMPKMGASGIKPVDATVTELRREFHVDNKGRVLAIHTKSKFEAAGGTMKFEGSHTMKETARRKLRGKTFAAFAEMIEEICAITQSREDTATRRTRAKKLQANAKYLGLGPTVKRLVDSLTRSGLPPGIGR